MKKRVFLSAAFAATSAVSQAAVVSISDTFGDNLGSFQSSLWTSIPGDGPSGGISTFRTASTRDGAASQGGAGDGALYFNTQQNVRNQAASFDFSGTIDLGEQFTLEVSVFNPVNSFNGWRASLYNATDDTELVFADGGLGGGTTGTQERTITYTAVASDVGDTLQLRFRDRTTSAQSARDFAVDYITFTAIPEPSSSAVLGIAFFGLLIRRRR